MRSEPTGPVRWEEDTVPLSRPLNDTLELPVVPAPAPPAVEQPVRPTAHRPPPPQRPAARRRGNRGWLVGLVLVLLVGAAAAAGVRLGTDRQAPGGSASGSAVTIRDVSSVDPSDGSGWRRSGSTVSSAVWRTQHYRSAEFGGLKPGVGLLVDLGTQRRLSSVRTTVGVPGTTVELRAGDAVGEAPDDFRRVSRADSASGDTTLRARDGGAHRYWLLWVPRLGRDDSGYSAELRGLRVRG